MNPHYRWYVGDLRTGRIKPVGMIDYTWSLPFLGPGALEASFPLKSGEWTTSRSDAAPGKSFLAVAYVNAAGDETFLEAGPIWKSKYTDSTGRLRLAAAGLWSYFDHRKVIEVLAANDDPAEASVTYNTRELGLIAKRLVELAQSHVGSDLPIVLPDDETLGGEGYGHTRTYPGYELGWVGERLKQLSEVLGGPEIQFVPQRVGNTPFIEWAMRIGVEPTMMLTQLGAPWLFDRSVPKSPVREIDIDTDGTRLAFRQWASGQGEAQGKPIEWAEDLELVDAGFPLLEGEVTSRDTVSQRDTLRGYVQEGLAFSRTPIETWTVTVSRDDNPTVDRYAAGDWAQIRVQDHHLLPDGLYEMRILSKAGNTGDTVTLQMSQRLAAVA